MKVYHSEGLELWRRKKKAIGGKLQITHVHFSYQLSLT